MEVPTVKFTLGGWANKSHTYSSLQACLRCVLSRWGHCTGFFLLRQPVKYYHVGSHRLGSGLRNRSQTRDENVTCTSQSLWWSLYTAQEVCFPLGNWAVSGVVPSWSSELGPHSVKLGQETDFLPLKALEVGCCSQSFPPLKQDLSPQRVCADSLLLLPPKVCLKQQVLPGGNFKRFLLWWHCCSKVTSPRSRGALGSGPGIPSRHRTVSAACASACSIQSCQVFERIPSGWHSQSTREDADSLLSHVDFKQRGFFSHQV